MSQQTFTGKDPSTGTRVRIDVHDGVIVGIEPAAQPEDDEPWIAPGLIDLQVNGHADGDANAANPSPAQIETMARTLAQKGVTRFLPTIITGSKDEMRDRLIAIVSAVSESLDARRAVAGIHVEGPSLSPEDGPRGVHPREHIRPPSISEFESWLDIAGDLLKVVTLSPHHDGAVEATRFLVEQGVRVAIGHTHADEEAILAVVDAGATLSTHLGNGAHQVLPRHPNYIWTQLAEPRLVAGVIADGHHLPDSTLKSILAAKGRDGAFLVSDAVSTPAALVEDGRSTIGGDVRLTEEGALRHVATGLLAGSVQTLDVGVANTARVTGSLDGALYLATQAPARAIGLPDVWRIGARADIIRFFWAPGDSAIQPAEVVVAGESIRIPS
ncbi:N-acetylglucosamine-6-phosphate deacetylase [Microbacterium esteraromaticum]|uniref:N-acetylglucosamine-6-phosphate deacetylase n=1 Tax=Microbacterium esteraromaticum TaxID=57043 RepID=A0A1R4IP23_9MICO|nr:amidohydrolase family protein [Microbacterium esteraromaticum]SJN21606.1 N-acetylglucosamine-6-phosphate deacetylase [Microbacterium esteraromaticum]